MSFTAALVLCVAITSAILSVDAVAVSSTEDGAVSVKMYQGEPALVPQCPDPTDCTASLQLALSNTNYSVVLLDNDTTPYISTPLWVGSRSNLKIVLANPKVLLLAKRWAFNDTGASLMVVNGCTNVTLDGNGGSFRMWKYDYANPKWYKHAEWRMTLNLESNTNFLVKNITLELSGGDGIYVGDSNKNITVLNVISRLNYRQGISVIDVDGLLVKDSVFESTQGTPPMAGVDFEPDFPSQQVRNVLFDGCIFRNNSGWQAVLAFHAYDNTSRPIGITMKNCVFATTGSVNGGVLISVASQNPSSAPEGGYAVFESNTILNSNNVAFFSDVKPANHQLKVDGLTIINNTASQPAILLDPNSFAEHTTISNVAVFQPQSKAPVMQVFPTSNWGLLKGNGVSSFSPDPTYECGYPTGGFVRCFPLQGAFSYP